MLVHIPRLGILEVRILLRHELSSYRQSSPTGTEKTETHLVFPPFDVEVFGVEHSIVIGDGDEVAELREVDDREVRSECGRDPDADLVCYARLQFIRQSQMRCKSRVTNEERGETMVRPTKFIEVGVESGLDDNASLLQR